MRSNESLSSYDSRERIFPDMGFTQEDRHQYQYLFKKFISKK